MLSGDNLSLVKEVQPAAAVYAIPTAAAEDDDDDDVVNAATATDNAVATTADDDDDADDAIDDPSKMDTIRGWVHFLYCVVHTICFVLIYCNYSTVHVVASSSLTIPAIIITVIIIYVATVVIYSIVQVKNF